MIISIINHTNGTISDEELQAAIRAINRQIKEDFEPYWSLGATLRLEGKSGKMPRKQSIMDMRGDAVIYLWDKIDVDNAIGYHDKNNQGIPYGFVFTELAKKLGEHWSVTLSHEALELIGDPEVNLLVAGSHPGNTDTTVFHWYEMCDAVQSETYQIDGIEVSNFVLPLYFTGGEELGGRNDFLGKIDNNKTLKSFGVNPGGYIGFFNPASGNYETYYIHGDSIAANRLAIKQTAKNARRSIRYQRFGLVKKPKKSKKKKK